MPMIAVNGIDQFYQDLNPAAKGTPLLLITGLGGVGDGWGPLIPLLAQDYRVLLPDHRGCGRSTRTLDGLTLPQIASDMAEIVRHVGCGPVHVVGSSTGGALGQRLAIDHPDVIRSLVAVASWGRSDGYFTNWFKVRKQVLLDAPYATHVQLTQFLLYSPEYWNRKTDQRIGQGNKMVADDGAHKHIEAARIDMLLVHDAIAELAATEIPLLALTGDHDVICPPNMGRELAAAVPHGDFQLLEGCGHYSHEEQPEAVQAAIKAFHQRVEAL